MRRRKLVCCGTLAATVLFTLAAAVTQESSGRFSVIEVTHASDDSNPQAATDKEIRQILIRSSIRSYSGSCPCPYSRDRAGRRCGKRSAYSRPGGASPLCYESDISQKKLDEYRNRHKIPKP